MGHPAPRLIASLSALIGTLPNWCELLFIGNDHFQCRAQVDQSSGIPSARYHLHVWSTADGAIRIREATPTHLPVYCPTRHIEEDGGWCVGLRSGFGIIESAGANAWWQKVRVFILLQETATRLGIWPPGAELPHGRAADVQIEAEELAEERNLVGIYADARMGRGVLHRAVDRLIRRANNSGPRLVNGRAPCLCGLQDRRGRPVLRRACAAAGQKCLVAMENERRNFEAQFIKDLRADGFQCYGTMVECPFRKT